MRAARKISCGSRNQADTSQRPNIALPELFGSLQLLEDDALANLVGVIPSRSGLHCLAVGAFATASPPVLRAIRQYVWKIPGIAAVLDAWSVCAWRRT